MLEWASPQQRRRVRNFLYNVGLSEEDVDSLPAPFLVVVTAILLGRGSPLPPPEEEEEEEWLPPPPDLEWRNGKYVLSDETQERVRRVRLLGRRVQFPFYVAPSSHYGTSVGEGLFSLLHLVRGRLLTQFVGRVSTESISLYIEGSDMRRDYVIETIVGARKYVINPLVDGDRRVGGVMAFINEPSRPPLSTGSRVRTTDGRGAVVRGRFQHLTGTIPLAFDEGGEGQHPVSKLLDVDASIANAAWFDFPLPLSSLYEPTGETTEDGHHVFRRTEKQESLLRLPLSELLLTHEFFSDTLAWYRMDRAMAKANLIPGSVVFLRPDVYPGLAREGLVVSWNGERAKVRHHVLPRASRVLPPRILCGLASRCDAKCEGGGCAKCEYVPFPVVCACRDVRPDEEILCLYTRRPHPSRGVGCTLSLPEDLLPPVSFMPPPPDVERV